MINLTREQILKSTYLDLFNGSASDNKKTLRLLLKKWHPDMNDIDTSDVFIHINSLYEYKPIDQSYTIGSKSYKYDFDRVTDLYTIYYTSSGMTIKFNNKHDEFGKNFINNLDKFKRGIESVKHRDNYKDIERLKLLESDSHYRINVPTGYIPLRAIIQYIIINKDWKISAWIISRLYDSAMIYKTCNITNVGFDPDFIYVNTKEHTIMDLSSLFVSVPVNECLKIAVTSFQASAIINSDIQSRLVSDTSINNMIRSVALILSGDLQRIGRSYILDDGANKDMVKIVNDIPITNSIIANYEEWQKNTVSRLFTERRFYKKELVWNDILKYMN